MSTLPQPVRSERADRATVLAVTIHVILWGVWLVGLMWFVPRFERIFRDFNMKLPTMTELVLALTRGCVPWALLLALTFLIIEGFGYLAFSPSGARRGVRMLWSGLMTVVPVVVILVTIVALWLPWIKLQEGLSK